MITDLLENDGCIAGAVGVHRLSGEVVSFKAQAVVIATADCRFRATGCIGQATGDGYRLACNVGARLNNMGFWGSNTGSPDYSFEGFSAVAADNGCRFLNARQEHFARRYTPAGDKAEPYQIAQAMADEVAKGNGPPFYFDMTSIRWRLIMKYFFKKNMRGYIVKVFDAMEEHGIDPLAAPQPWVPVTRTIRGGIRTDTDGMSDLPGLFAAGTAQSLDPAGLNGYSTMRAMWSGERAGQAVAKFLDGTGEVSPDAETLRHSQFAARQPIQRKAGVAPDAVTERLQRAIFPVDVSLRKNETALQEALTAVEMIRENDLPQLFAQDPHELVKAHETKSMVLTAELYLCASLARRESRGDHYRADHPHTDNQNWLKWLNIKRESHNAPILETENVPFERYRLQPEMGGQQ